MTLKIRPYVRKKTTIKIKFQKNEEYFFGLHPLFEKSPTATANNVTRKY